MHGLLMFIAQEASSLERRLAQLATFFYGERATGSPGEAAEGICEGVQPWNVPPTCSGPTSGAQGSGTHWRQSARLTELADARMQCKGALTAAHDARAIGK
jgi:hypothetical protein